MRRERVAVTGEVTLDQDALAAYRRLLPRWVPCHKEDLQDETVRLTYQGRALKGSYTLSGALAYAQEYGDVTGKLTVDVQEGVNSREVLIYTGREVNASRSDCLNHQTYGYTQKLLKIHDKSTGDKILILHDHPTARRTQEILHGEKTSMSCRCQGPRTPCPRVKHDLDAPTKVREETP